MRMIQAVVDLAVVVGIFASGQQAVQSLLVRCQIRDIRIVFFDDGEDGLPFFFPSWKGLFGDINGALQQGVRQGVCRDKFLINSSERDADLVLFPAARFGEGTDQGVGLLHFGKDVIQG